MILTLLLVLSKCIKPFFKKQFYTDFSLVEEMIILNLIFFICALLFYKINNNISNIISKFNNNNVKLIITYLLLTLFELYISNILISQESNISKLKIIQKGLYLVITPIIGIYFFNEKWEYNNIIGLGFIIMGICISS